MMRPFACAPVRLRHAPVSSRGLVVDPLYQVVLDDVPARFGGAAAFRVWRFWAGEPLLEERHGLLDDHLLNVLALLGRSGEHFDRPALAALWKARCAPRTRF